MDNKCVLVYDACGGRLDNTVPRKAKMWLKSGRAVVVSKNPFSIKLLDAIPPDHKTLD